MATETQQRKRLLVWMPGIRKELIDELSLAGFDVVAIGLGSFPGIECISLYDMFYGGPTISRFGLEAAPPDWLSAEWFRRYSLCMQRVGFVPSSTNIDTRSGSIVPGYDLEDMARLHLSYSATVLKGLSIDEVWFADPPHLAVDMMLSLAAQKMGIRVIEFMQVPWLPKFRVRVNEGKDVVCWDRVPRKPWVLGAGKPNIRYMEALTRQPLWRSLYRGALQIPALLITGGWGAASERLHYWSYRIERPNLISRMLDRRDPKLAPWVGLRKQLHRRFKKNKASIERIHDLTQIGDFIYFPLHLEPEKNIHILGRNYSNQLDAAQMMRAAMPDNWTLLLKENPKQGYLHRGDAFYARLRMMPGVRVVSDDMPSSELIEKSRLVATIVGTAGYESLLAGKPCVYFGDAWYAGLPGAFQFDDGIDVKAIAASSPDKTALDRGMNELLGCLPDGIAYPRHAAAFNPAELPGLYRETARTMAAVSAAVMDGDEPHCAHGKHA